MDKFVIHGGGKLRGTIMVGGSKNGTLPLMAAALLTKGVTSISGSPHLQDVATMSNVLRVSGARVYGKRHELKIDTATCNHFEAPYDLVKTMRASFYVLGPLVARYGRARVSLPGGCAWGPRPVDLHLKGLEALGAQIKNDHGYIEARAKYLVGATFEFDKVSVGATAQLVMAATLARGVSRLVNTAKEPEILMLVQMLRKMGAQIQELPDGLKITGVRKLKPVHITVMPDRIEAGTYIAAATLAGGSLRIENCPIDHLSAAMDVFSRAGAVMKKAGPRVLVVQGPKVIKPMEISTAPFPGFPTDLQAQLMAVLSMARGTSIITDTVYHDRFTHVAELKRLGADISVSGNSAIIQGVASLTGAEVMATDLRASAALVIAGLRARGTTKLDRVYHIDRGYEHIEEKFNAVGARIERIKEAM
ncbi:MAG: UDP-N-acetylglucosamine 1-carboxyvinyltransferase [Candidatus Raymondbacteria bacterium RifOxyA12_full_50_37]|nr:MAG: UDP-N-acetylglucosamine 1-carboxyvinyltransferase [Candidatus Raymondbacteria bacterium RifOxyA12_full_50_37]OGJ88705.1 MAG: UDP-N-acetylglucosamine 1-carboxyvinyltransferase [Candidatus Raymondbacteria bacterium RIFOXYA2_FULL_49_16]OGJ94481.1 MAG: UDP-N-acetylglucosamine 1-carboxyvinyltransferase [Candidatus Raymondbacteria bacterium RifOxyC12_full_50_8]OGP41742.1 MAG: UDP-N-acetylglucosamine 1-carboxyvinyltransferase [Candidatus Raymondbacteria bacterium RIFOXYB2_FULL_49_35]